MLLLNLIHAKMHPDDPKLCKNLKPGMHVYYNSVFQFYRSTILENTGHSLILAGPATTDGSHTAGYECKYHKYQQMPIQYGDIPISHKPEVEISLNDPFD